MARPSGLKEWASEKSSLITEPGDGQKKTGFTIEQPSVNVVNWVLNNIYRWIDYFDLNTGGGSGGLTHVHNSSRPRLQIPFNLPVGNKLSGLTVSKRIEESVGGVSSCLLYTSPSPRDRQKSRMPSSA